MVLGIDIGSCYTKGVLIDGSRQARHVVKTSFKPKAAIAEIMGKLKGYDRIVATGYGRGLVPDVHRTITEISALARGAAHLNPAVRTVIDIGGQDSKIIKLRDRKVERFIMNDRCAAGTGNFVEKISLSLGLDLEEFGRLALASERPETIDSLCVVMAETEILSLVSEEKKLEDIVLGVCDALIRRLIGLGSQVGIEEPVLFCGGGALNPGLVKALKRAIKDVSVPADPQFVGALGAAVS